MSSVETDGLGDVHQGREVKKYWEMDYTEEEIYRIPPSLIL